MEKRETVKQHVRFKIHTWITLSFEIPQFVQQTANTIVPTIPYWSRRCRFFRSTNVMQCNNLFNLLLRTCMIRAHPHPKISHVRNGECPHGTPLLSNNSALLSPDMLIFIPHLEMSASLCQDRGKWVKPIQTVDAGRTLWKLLPLLIARFNRGLC